jgi:pseudaminic acid biosynthesis-associated methylase
MKMTTQLEQWRGDFGNAYIDRCPADDDRLRRSTSVWAKLLSRMAGDPPSSILEVGANIGANLQAIRRLSDAEIWAIEPNDLARKSLIESKVTPADHVFAAAAQQIPLPTNSVDLAFAAGVLIHISPDDLLSACSEIYRCSRKYILCMEYFSDQPEEKNYRGHQGLLFKRDFGSFYLDNFPDLVTVDCGFNWKRTTGLDNETWWIFKKAS